MKNIALIGFMGTGKTSSGKLLANRIGYSFIDTDYKIELDNNMTIAEMFALHGEAYFRRREADTVRKVASHRHTVISTGGGVVLNPENMDALRMSGFVISLKASVDAILERTSRRNVRPLLEREDRRETVLRLLENRDHLYEQADFTVDTTALSPMQVVDEIVKFIRKENGMRV